MRRTYISVISFCGILVAVVSYASGVVPFGKALEQRHIALTKEALVAALRNPEPEIRSLAAFKLLWEDHAVDTIPLVEAALRAEENPIAKKDLAYSLAKTGDELGFAGLQAACAEAGLIMPLRLQAAGYLQSAGREGCLNTVLEALDPHFEDGRHVLSALSLVPGFKHLTEGESKTLADAVLRHLDAEGASLRRAASHALSQWGRVSVLPDLRNARDRETDPTTRASMESDLKLLEAADVANRQR